jgi:hypothetical protein
MQSRTLSSSDISICQLRTCYKRLSNRIRTSPASFAAHIQLPDALTSASLVIGANTKLVVASATAMRAPAIGRQNKPKVGTLSHGRLYQLH